ncbi:hypothetical protein [Streptosporangium sp. NPDC000396]|uniref:hypothetical protein n=1 Tax=Streptosporangium sp. NPDC000396 TaxID=3366185 RepID=UPI0036C4622D
MALSGVPNARWFVLAYIGALTVTRVSDLTGILKDLGLFTSEHVGMITGMAGAVVLVAAGDAAAPSGQPLRMSGYAAGPLGAQAANTVLSRIEGTEPVVIDLAFTGACVSLGRRAGIRQLARKDDTAVNVYIGGRMGAVIKEVTCKFAVSMRIRQEARKPGSMGWPKGGPRPGQPASAARVVTSP